jgi:prepilin-type N-terminal cleavage/methylation domain-containing protein
MLNQKGFTLLEILTVLIILGILAAVAVTRYIDLYEEAKVVAARVEVAEMKSTLNIAYARVFIRTGTAPTIVAVLADAGFEDDIPSDVGTPPDVWNVTLKVAGTSVNISVNSRNGETDYAAIGTWEIP